MEKLNKREFLKMTSLLGAGAAVPAVAAVRCAFEATKPDTPNRKRVGLLGLARRAISNLH